MRIFPYRWLPRTFFPNIGYFFLWVKDGLINVIKWTPIIWADQDYDWEFLADILQFKMENMVKDFEGLSFMDESVKDLKTCIELIKRLKKDDFDEVQWWQHTARMGEWQRMLGKIIGRKLMTWWS